MVSRSWSSPSRPRGLEGLLQDLETIEGELKAYGDGSLAQRPRLIVLSQIDQPWLQDLEGPFLDAMAARNLPALACSGISKLGCDQFLLALAALLDPGRAALPKPEETGHNPAC